MNLVFYNILIAIVGLAMSPFITALIERYSKEEKIFTKDFMKDVRFDGKVALFVPLAFIGILFYYGLGFHFVFYSFIAVILIISFFVDLKAQIIPNETNFIGFLVGILLAYYYLTQDFNMGINRLLGMVAGGGIFLLIALFSYLVYL